ncbi:Predicted phosphoesterase [Alteracholeplasma palmae J233]|uniref:Phosphoesterase n=1 Tax=Alteracholeplasma palmae (strain ATCC 49389 / J233) TaxID=1318466 RepID=U4KRN1_ALTPJ|nr:YfcE family phosphodiesterase [Alteracholeplasma palmae]CCV64311.1 Predicted phosphoesterase [Alteracholeplasma palmae J233]
MKILITGDIHGKLDLLEQVIEKHPDIDYHLNTGDLSISIKDISQNDIIAVKGNADIYVTLPESRILNIDNEVIYLTHGHIENVKYGLNKLREKAKLQKATICIFGHTHKPLIELYDDILYLNPGSLKEAQHLIHIL